MAAHALLSPSSAHRWMRCAGSLAASGEPKDDSNQFAREGTAAHTLGERALQYADQGRKAEFWIGETISVPYKDSDGNPASQDFVIDQEMANYVQVYVDQVLREPGELIIEEQLDMEPVYGIKDQFGTGDAVVLDYENERIYVGDLKYGRGVQVYAEDNEQLYSYGAAAFLQFDMLCEWKSITVAVHQPRLHHYDEFTLTREEMLAWIEYAQGRARLAMTLRACEDPAEIEKAKTPGEKQCQWCPVKGSCSALATWAHDQVFEDFVSLDAEPAAVRDPVKMTNDVLAAIWARRDTINGWLTEVQAETKRRLESGMDLPGLKLVQGRSGARSWIDAEAAEEQMKTSRLKQDEMYSKKLISPTQAEKLLKKDRPRVWAKFEAMITQKEGAPAVAPEADKRPALKVAEADQFDDVSDDDFGDLV